MRQDTMDRRGLADRRRRMGPGGLVGRGKGKRPVLTLAPPPGSPPSAGGSRRRRRGGGSALWLVVVPAGVLLVALTVQVFQTVRRAAVQRPTVVASLPYWNLAENTSAVLMHRQVVSEVSPWIYRIGSDGQIVLDSGINAPGLARDLGRLRAGGLPIVPTLANIDAQGNWSYQPVAAILHDPALRARQVATIAALVERHSYAGIDIDYEELRAGDRQAFTAFVTSLGTALHARGKVLSVALFAKASDAGYAPRNVAQNYAAIGRAADQVRLMGYDFHWGSSPPGAIAPVSWIGAVLRYATAQVPARKIILGIPFYGYDWVGDRGTPVTWQQAVQLAHQHHATIHYDVSSQAPWFAYTGSRGNRHTVWFENGESSRAKFALARRAGIGGVYLWMYGDGEPSTWSALRQVLPAARHTAIRAAGGAP